MEWKHIVVGDVVAGSLRAAFENDPLNAYAGEIRNFKDDLTLGRIDRVMETIDDRCEWFTHITKGTEFGDYVKGHIDQEMKKLYEKTLVFDTDDRIVIWHSGIIAEEVALRYFAERLQGHDLWEVDISKLDLTPRKEAIIRPRATGACSPEELLKALEKIEVLPAERREQYRAEWGELCATVSTLRVMKDGKPVSVEETYYDQGLMSLSTEEFQSAARLAGTLMGTSDQIISDTFLDYRLRVLINEKQVDWRGNLSALRLYEVRRRS